MADQLQSWFTNLPYKLQRELAGALREIADGLADDIRAAAPLGKTGRLRQSIQVSRGRNTLELVVSAGGPLTTKEYSRNTRYRSEVRIPRQDDPAGWAATQGIARSVVGPGVTYDYALAVEFGTSKMAAKPFFFSTYRAHAADIRQKIEDAVSDVLSKA